MNATIVLCGAARSNRGFFRLEQLEDLFAQALTAGSIHEESYVDACHLCYTAHAALRQQFADVLAPDQMYGVTGD